MAYFINDNLHTRTFTPRDYQVELIAAAREKNIIICLNQSKEFIVHQLVLEFASEIRKNLAQHKIVVYISDSLYAYHLLYHLTDLRILRLADCEQKPVINEVDVLFCEIDDIVELLTENYCSLSTIRLLIVDECHKHYGNAAFVRLFDEFYENCTDKPRVVGLAGALHNAGCELARLGAEVEFLERLMRCKAETTSDVSTVLRYYQKPKEVLLQCAPTDPDDLTECIKNILATQRQFLEDHRYDPSEIYSDEEYLDELKAIPDPKIEPLQFLEDFTFILNELGPWCADRAAFSFLIKLEKAKVKTKYERHFLLLNMVSTTIIRIRSICNSVFEQIEDRKTQVEKYSTSKVLRMLEVLRLFKPVEPEKPAIEPPIDSPDCEVRQELNIQKLTKVIEETGQKIETITKDLEGLKIKVEDIQIGKKLEQQQTQQQSPARNFRTRKKGGNQRYQPRHNSNYDADSLCGIIFCYSKSIAKALFSLFIEMSKNDPELNFLNVQYTVDKVADPLLEPKEAENEHRKQEEVLKRFRMHDCNLLIGTSVLEEGIELPKCNLVIRWDPPVSYQSYVQCKGRARAAKAYHVMLIAAETTNETDFDESREIIEHKLTCNADNEPIELYLQKEAIEEDDTEDEEELEPSEPKIVEIPNEDSIKDEEEKKETEVDDTDDQVDEPKPEADQEIIRVPCVYQDTLPLTSKTTTNNSLIESRTREIIDVLAEYMQIEKMLLQKCENIEPPEFESEIADRFTRLVQPYKPEASVVGPPNNLEVESTSVDLSSAIALVNKYCAKLPSDTFTKLTPLWRCGRVNRNGHDLFIYTVRLPINSPLKQDIVGLPMPSRILARRMAALMTCRALHESGELDNALQPIGKESFCAYEPDWENFELEAEDEKIVQENLEPRPGTTKRRQYYYKKIASAFNDCRPLAGEKINFYFIKMVLTCPIPEEQNTRGRKIYPPEESVQGFGILTSKTIPKVSSFPIFTRSGEVKVSLELISSELVLSQLQIDKINTFVNYTFTKVLRLQKYLMLFDAEAMQNCFFIVPVIRNSNDVMSVDWDFLGIIADSVNMTPQHVSDDVRKDQAFDPNKFKDAVVMPWYRNQDFPQYFYVAEICYYLTPNSSFPGDNYSTFKEYYSKKYGIEIQNLKQPLLDVDHTSARLNFLTPRYVNRKGVALPTSSEETKRAKRENLEQKQILVPELCTIHPFSASLWRAAVCLPCILYRINALLLADEIRKQVSRDLDLGWQNITDESFEWPMLNFGWSLADVLKKSREAKSVLEDTVDSTKDDSKVEEVQDVQTKPPDEVKSDKDKTSEEKDELDDTKRNDAKIEDADDDDLDGAKKDSKTPPLLNGEKEEKSANELLEEATMRKKEKEELEIGTWSNEMANNLKDDFDDSFDDEDDWGLPSNISMCTRQKTRIRYGSPTSWEPMDGTGNVQNFMSHHNYYSDDSDLSSDDYEENLSDKDDQDNFGLKIEFKSDNLAEAVETEEEIQKRQRQLEALNSNQENRSNTKDGNYTGFNCIVEEKNIEIDQMIERHSEQFFKSKDEFKDFITTSDMLVPFDQKLTVTKGDEKKCKTDSKDENEESQLTLQDLVPYVDTEQLREISYNGSNLTIDQLKELDADYRKRFQDETEVIEGTGDVFDRFNDNIFLKITSDGKKLLIKGDQGQLPVVTAVAPYTGSLNENNESDFSFDYQPDLRNHPGPSPSIILQALTMSNANDGINLERLETIGDSFLKYAITTYLYLTYENVHEGKLSHLRSKQVSNLNLYRLGRRKILGESMIATKFEPHDNWLPPLYFVPKELEQALIAAKIPACHWNLADLPNIKQLSSEEICRLVKERAEEMGYVDDDSDAEIGGTNTNLVGTQSLEDFPCFIPYNLVTQHSIPDKSIADCVEALIGAYLIECGPKGALLFMAWLGIRVLPIKIKTEIVEGVPRYETIYEDWTVPKSPLIKNSPTVYDDLDRLLDGFEKFEEILGYRFRDRSYLLQAMTHASFSPNRLTDCYQRLEFLGDAVLDYLITRHLYEDPRQHSPGALTDLRSALVNNTIFASLAVRHGFHKYFRHLSPGLNDVIDRFVRIQHENNHCISEEFYLLSEDECDEAEDVEVPKALGDVFESVAGAIFLDSHMSLDAVWRVYSNMMKPEIEQFSNSVPKSPIRELLELEPETAKFGKPEKLADGRRVRVTVEVFGKGTYRGIGRNYRIAKCTAAKCALRQLKKLGLTKKHN